MSRLFGAISLVAIVLLGGPATATVVPLTRDNNSTILTDEAHIAFAVKISSQLSDDAGGLRSSISVSQVPLPASAWLFLSALAGIVWLSSPSAIRRRTKRLLLPSGGNAAGQMSVLSHAEMRRPAAPAVSKSGVSRSRSSAYAK